MTSLNIVAARLYLSGVEHEVVSAKKYEETQELDDLNDDYVEAVVKFLRKAAADKVNLTTKYAQYLKFDDMNLPEKLRRVFGPLTVQIIPATIVDTGDGLPLIKVNGGYARAFYNPSNKTVVFPYLDSRGYIVEKYVKSFHMHQVVAHEVQHYLDYNGFTDDLDPKSLNNEHEDNNWINRTTEFNAVMREVTYSVRRLLREIELDQQSAKPKFKPEKIVELFTTLSDKKMFDKSILQSMLRERSSIAVFEFGDKSNVQRMATQYKGASRGAGLYRFVEDFDGRLTEIYRFVRDWYLRLNNKLNLDGKRKLAAEIVNVPKPKTNSKPVKLPAKKTPGRAAPKKTTSKPTKRIATKVAPPKGRGKTAAKPVAKPKPKKR